MAAPGARSQSPGVTSTHDLGKRFEARVARHLERRGFRVLDRNVRFRRKEIDLVIRRGSVVAFVEVKGRRGPGWGHPLEAVTWKKRREIATVAAWWVARNGREGWIYRFDAVAVDVGQDGAVRIDHVEDAWRLELDWSR